MAFSENPVCPEWRSKDGHSIPVAGSHARAKFEKALEDEVIKQYADGDAGRVKRTQLPLNSIQLGEFEANPHRQKLYSKMVEAGEELPPIVVRRVGNEFHILDGKHRVAAMKNGKVPETWVHEIEGSGLTGDDLNKAEKWTPNGLYHELIPVAHLESDFGRSATHIPHPMGDWETPFGAVGMKPSAAWEEYLRSSKLQQLFPTPNPADSEWFSIKLKAEPEMYNLIASSLFARLKARFGNTPKAVYAWRWGDGAASGASDEQVANDEYVQKYAQKAAESGLKKAEPLNTTLPPPKAIPPPEWLPKELHSKWNKMSDNAKQSDVLNIYDGSSASTKAAIRQVAISNWPSLDSILRKEAVSIPQDMVDEVFDPSKKYGDNWQMSIMAHPDAYGKISREQLSDTIFNPQNRRNSSLLHSAFSSPNTQHLIDEEIIEGVIDRQMPGGVQGAAIMHPKATDAQKVRTILREDNQDFAVSMLKHSKLSPKALLRVAAEKPGSTVGHLAAQHPDFGAPELKKLAELAQEDSYLKPTLQYALPKNPNVDEDVLGDIVSRFPMASGISQTAIRHPKAGNDMLMSAIHNSDGVTAAVQNPNLNSGMLDHILHNHPNNLELWGSVAKHPNATREHLDRVLAHPDIIQNGFDSNEGLRAALKSPHATDEDVERLVARIGDTSGHELHKLFQQKLQFKPDSFHTEKVSFSHDTNKLRKLRDSLDEQGGSVHKSKIPNFPKTLGHLLDSKGNLSSKKIQEHIDSLPKETFNVAHTKWEGPQRHNKDNSDVFQLQMTDNHVKAMKEAGVWDTYKKLHDTSFNSGHPVNTHTVGWVRHTGDKDGVQIDELQSDLGQNLSKMARAQAQSAGEDEDQAEARVNAKLPQDHLDKIKQIVFGNKHPNVVLHEAFRQHLRDKGMADTTVHVHAAATKAPLSGQDPDRPIPVHMKVTYDEHPQKMGMEPAEYGELKTQDNRKLAGKPQWKDTVRKKEE